MSFHIHASGTDGFRYNRRNCIDSGEFETLQTLVAIQSMDYSVTDAVASALDIENPLQAPGVVDLAESVATRQFLHLITSSVDAIAMNPRARDGWITVHCRRASLIWADSTRFARYRFSPLEEPGLEFARAIFPALEETDYNTWGVLRQLGLVLYRYSTDLQSSSTPMLSIQVFDG
jgi:hypothetical protein